jgi:hypothetical protein
MPEPVQTYKNHARRDIPYMAAMLILVTNFVTVTVTAIRFDVGRFAWITLLWIGVAFATVVIGLKARTNPLKAQDRVIRLEERLRYAATLAPTLVLRAESLTLRQIIALRFASDAELPALIDRTLTENLTSKQIKESITTWRPDTYRI